MNESNLHGYQKACVQYIINKPFCGLFVDMGLGKTVSTLTAINNLMYDSFTVYRVLIVAPKRVAETVWAEEAQLWDHLKHFKFSKIIGSPEKRIEALRKEADIYVISRDNVVWLFDNWRKAEKGKDFPFDMIVIDELSSFKTNSSKRFKAMRKLRAMVSRMVGLTGTPAPNSLLDLWPQLYLLDRGERLGKFVTEYRSRYFKPTKYINGIACSYTIREGCAEEIENKIKDICISMKAKDFLDMPPLVMNYIKLSFPPTLHKRYRAFRNSSIMEMTEGGENIMALSAVDLSNKLLQFCNGAVYSETEEGKRVTNEIHDLKVEALRDILEEANGQPVLVATSFQFDESKIKEKLSEYNPRKLVSAKDQEDWNAGKIRLLFAHPASVGHGLNLQRGGHIIVWYGLTWSLELYQQFNARLFRQGQSMPVIVHHLYVGDTHEEDIILALRAKDAGQNALKESIKAEIDKYLKDKKL